MHINGSTKEECKGTLMPSQPICDTVKSTSSAVFTNSQLTNKMLNYDSAHKNMCNKHDS
jgi:hypothetical protein